MNLDLLYNNIVKSCPKCKGTGTVEVTETSIRFCECMEFYITATQMLELGVPLKYIMGYTPVEVDLKKKIYFVFKDDQHAFNTFITLAREPNKQRMFLTDSMQMYYLSNYQEKDGVMIHNLGLETKKDSSLVLYRIIKEVEERDLYGIFSFAISRDKLDTYYSQFIVSRIHGF